MPKKNKKGPTAKKVRSGKSKTLLELREFKGKLRKWVDNTRIVWPDGKPWQDKSTYYFVLDQRLVDFVHHMIMKGRSVQDPDEMETALKQRIEEVNAALAKDGGMTEKEFTDAMGDVLTEDGDGDEEGVGDSNSEEGVVQCPNEGEVGDGKNNVLENDPEV